MKLEKKHTLSAKRLAEALADAGLRAQDLVNKTGIPKASISHYLNGYYCPTSTKAAKIGKVLNVNPVWLMGFDVPKKIVPQTDPSSLEQALNQISYVVKNPLVKQIVFEIDGMDESNLSHLLKYIRLLKSEE